MWSCRERVCGLGKEKMPVEGALSGEVELDPYQCHIDHAGLPAAIHGIGLIACYTAIDLDWRSQFAP